MESRASYHNKRSQLEMSIDNKINKEKSRNYCSAELTRVATTRVVYTDLRGMGLILASHILTYMVGVLR